MLTHRLAAAARPSGHPAKLSACADELIGKLPHVRHSYGARHRLVREGERQSSCYVLLSGFAHRHRVTTDGQRQITRLYVPGDVVGLDGGHGGPSRQGIEAAGPVAVAAISLAELGTAARDDAGLAVTLWAEALAEAAATSEWVVNIGRRNARDRILNLFCELNVRLERAGVALRGAFDLPLTQADLADATGLTPVHVNRVIRSLESEGVIERRGRAISFKDWRFVAGLADFQPGWWQRLETGQAN